MYEIVQSKHKGEQFMYEVYQVTLRVNGYV